jgi:isoquinoline 1-oxidoreductase beta subunit
MINTPSSRRTFLRNTVLAGGGVVLGINWLTGCKNASGDAVLAMPKEWFNFNAYLKIGENGVVTIFSPNPEFGQNEITSMPLPASAVASPPISAMPAMPPTCWI